MTQHQHRALLAHARRIPAEERAAGTWYLLVPEGMPHDADLIAEAQRLGCHAIVSPHEGASRAHRQARRAGLDVSRPVVWRLPDTGR